MAKLVDAGDSKSPAREGVPVRVRPLVPTPSGGPCRRQRTQPDMSTDEYFQQELPPAGIGRRLVALIYDAFLIAAIWFATVGIWVLVDPYTGLPTEDINGVTRAAPWVLKGILFPLMVLEVWAFYAWFWLHGGQTLGMRAWKLLSRDYRRRPMTLWQTIVRFIGGTVSWGLAGAGYLVALLPPNQTLHDRLSATETVVVPKAR